MGWRAVKYLKIYLAFFLPILALTLFFSAVYYLKEKNHGAALLEKTETLIIEKQQALIEKKIFSVVSDIKILASHHELSEPFKSAGDRKWQALTYEFFQFCKHKGLFDQIRLIDLNGMEVVRVNYNKGKPFAVPTEQLQDKSGRYYFLDTMRLQANEIFISPFDLNIESGEIETPLKPMIRFTTPVFDNKNIKVGILVLNYFGIDLLNILAAEESKIMLVNANGHWLKGPSPEDEWGFMFRTKADKRIQSHFPDAWPQIRNGDSGQFSNENGLFTYSTVKPLYTGMKSSLGSPEPYVGDVTPEITSDDYFWKLIAWVSPESLAAKNHELLRKIGLFDGVILLLLATGCFFITREYQKRKEADMNLRQTKATLQSVFNGSIPICVTNFDYDILLVNDEYNKVFKTDGSDPHGPPKKCYESRPSPICKTEACPLQRIAEGEEKVTFEVAKTAGDKNIQYFIVNARPLYSGEGEPVGIVESYLDITERDKLEKDRDRLISELQESFKKVKTLSGFLPICASCKKIRDDQGYWNQIESYISTHSDAEFSHGICPDCVKDIYPDQYKKIFPEKDED